MSASRRLLFVDALRSLAIALALAAHAINDFDIASHLGWAEFVGLRLFTRSATPAFIFMFGMMLELVYARKVAERGLRAVMPRLLWRSAQCYAGYAVTVAAGWAMGLFGGAHFAQALLFIGGGHHGNILKFYTVALLAAVVLLAVRERYGLRVTLAACLGVWLLDPMLDLLTSFSLGRFNTVRSLFLQTVPHHFTFVAAGLFAGHALRGGSLDALSRAFVRHLGWIAGTAALIVGVLVWQTSAGAVLDGYLYYEQYRSSKHIGYYALGLLQTAALCYLLFRILPPHAQGLSPRSTLFTFGRSSLLSFTAGNVLLNVMYGLPVAPVGPQTGAWGTVAFLIATLGVVLAIEQGLGYVRRASTLSRLLLGPVEHLRTRTAVWVSDRLYSGSRTLLRHARLQLPLLRREPSGQLQDS